MNSRLGEVPEFVERPRKGQPNKPRTVDNTQRLCQIKPQIIRGFDPRFSQRLLKLLSFVVRDGRPLLPRLIGCRTRMAPRSADCVGQLAGVFQVFGGPAVRMPFDCCTLLGVGFVGAVGSLESPVVLGTPRGREELGHNRLEHGRLSRLGDEGRAVVALEDQGRSVFEEQVAEDRQYRLGLFVGHRLPGQLLMARQITNGEDVRIDPIDRMDGLAEVDRPDGARVMPCQLEAGYAISASPDATIAAEQLLKDYPRYFRKEGPQGRQPDSRTGYLVQEADHFVAGFGAASSWRPPAEADIE